MPSARPGWFGEPAKRVVVPLRLHVGLQPSPFAILPSSQTSSAWTTLSPHDLPTSSSWHVGLHPSPAFLLPSSHSSSLTRSSLPSPHVAAASIVQVALQPSPAAALPSSHSSPAIKSTLPSPQLAGVTEPPAPVMPPVPVMPPAPLLVLFIAPPSPLLEEPEDAAE